MKGFCLYCARRSTVAIRLLNAMCPRTTGGGHRARDEGGNLKTDFRHGTGGGDRVI